MRKKIIQIIILIIFILIISYFAQNYLTFENIKENKEELKTFVTENYIISIILFFISTIILVNTPIPFAAIIKIIGGFLFGITFGFIINIISTLIGAILGFLVSRYLLKDYFEKKYYKRLKSIEDEIETNGFTLFLSLRIILIIPFFLINIIGGISRISLKRYSFATFIGLIPSSFIYAYSGNTLEKINSISEIISPKVFILFIFLAILIITPNIIKKYKKGKSIKKISKR